MKGLRKTTKVC